MFSVTLHLETAGFSSEEEWTSTCHGISFLEAMISVHISNRSIKRTYADVSLFTKQERTPSPATDRVPRHPRGDVPHCRALCGCETSSWDLREESETQ